MTDVQVIDAEVVGTEVVHHSSTLFRTDDPVEVVEQASRVADALKGVLKRQGLTSNISGKEHVRVEGWTTLGSMLGVVPVVVWTRKLENGWEARVEARTLDGRVVGAAEAECLTDEKRWKTADDYAVRSMAQTRATSKALRGPLGFIVTLAGYDATPSEEIPAEPFALQGKAPARETPAPAAMSTPDQYEQIKALFKASGADPVGFATILDQQGAPEAEGIAARVAGMSKVQADALIAELSEAVA